MQTIPTAGTTLVTTRFNIEADYSELTKNITVASAQFLMEKLVMLTKP